MKRKNLGRAVLVLFLLLPALAVWWPLWFMGTGALMPLDELRAALGPVLQGAEGSAFWPLLPSWPTLQPLAELLLDTPQFFTMFWNTCAIVFPQVLGQVLVGAPAAWAFSRLRFRGRRAGQKGLTGALVGLSQSAGELEGDGRVLFLHLDGGLQPQHVVDGALGEPDGAGNCGTEDVLPRIGQPAVSLDGEARQAAALGIKCDFDHN